MRSTSFCQSETSDPSNHMNCDECLNLSTNQIARFFVLCNLGTDKDSETPFFGRPHSRSILQIYCAKSSTIHLEDFKMAPAEVHHTPNMSTNRRMKSQEEKYAHDLACDYIHYNKLGKEAFRVNTKVAATLRKIGREVETRHELLLKNMCDKLDIRTSTAAVTFRTVADEIFSTGINWGRIVVLYCFAAEVAMFCNQHEIDIVEDVVRWLSEYVSERTLAEWIKKSGGWEAFCEQFKDVQDEREKFWWNSILCTTLGLGTLAAMLYVKS